jgi:ankyrin repeat protein
MSDDGAVLKNPIEKTTPRDIHSPDELTSGDINIIKNIKNDNIIHCNGWRISKHFFIKWVRYFLKDEKAFSSFDIIENRVHYWNANDNALIQQHLRTDIIIIQDNNNNYYMVRYQYRLSYEKDLENVEKSLSNERELAIQLGSITDIMRSFELTLSDEQLTNLNDYTNHPTIKKYNEQIKQLVTTNAKEKHIDLITLVSLGAVKEVQQKLQDGWDPNVQNEDGISPALKAAERNDLIMLQILSNAGANLHVQDIFGHKCIMYAYLYDNVQMVAWILDRR